MPYYQILKMWLIPPGIFILSFIFLAAYLGLCAHWSRNSAKGLYRTLIAGAVFCTVCAVITFGISVHAGSARLLRSLEYKYPRSNIKPDAIIILGGDDVRRELSGARLYHKYGVDLVVSGHNGEAAKMKNNMLAKAVPAHKIIEEPLATNTRDHAKYIIPIVKERGYRKVYVVTSAYHMPRSVKNLYPPFKAAGVEILPYASSYIVTKNHIPNKYEWIPYVNNMKESTIAWHEYLGLLELCVRDIFNLKLTYFL